MMIMSKKNNIVLMQPPLPSPNTERSGTQTTAVGSAALSPIVQPPLSSGGIFNRSHPPTSPAKTNKILNKKMDVVPASSSLGHQHPPGSSTVGCSSNSGSNRHHVHFNNMLKNPNKKLHGELNINEHGAIGKNRAGVIGNNDNIGNLTNIFFFVSSWGIYPTKSSINLPPPPTTSVFFFGGGGGIWGPMFSVDLKPAAGGKCF